MKNAFAQTRDFISAEYGLTEYEAWTIITTGVDFATTQLVDGNWGVHAVRSRACVLEQHFLSNKILYFCFVPQVVPKSLFAASRKTCPAEDILSVTESPTGSPIEESASYKRPVGLMAAFGFMAMFLMI